MKRWFPAFIYVTLTILLALTTSSGAESVGKLVLAYHGDPARNGNFIVPSLTWARASSLQLDTGFNARISGHVYAQPLYWRSSESSSAALLVATEDNLVYAIDAVSGQEK